MDKTTLKTSHESTIVAGLIGAIDLQKISGNLITYFHLDHSINVEFVNWPLISMHDVRLCLKLLPESKKM